MYYDFFGFREAPFSIAPDPRYLYLSERHKEALAHLMYGVRGQGGFIVITGEVGTGKTTVSRCFIENVPEHVDIALILNPRLSARELLSSICDELGISHPPTATIKMMVDLINQDLLKAHSRGRHKVLMIDEAQNLSADVLEQLRLLTNLETAEKKLLQIVLLGQPELQDILARPELRQLNQRVTARYHLGSLDRSELVSYLRYRVNVAGIRSEIFSEGAVRQLYRASKGIPRLINLIADRALLGAYAEGEHEITATHIRSAAKEMQGSGDLKATRTSPKTNAPESGPDNLHRIMLLIVTVLAVLVIFILMQRDPVNAGDGDSAGEDAPVAEDTENSISGIIERVSPVRAGGDSEADQGDDFLEPFSFDQHALPQVTAFRVLYQTWGRSWEPSENPIACDFAAENGLGCLQRQGSRSSLEQVNRPVILTLRDEAGNRGHVVLRRLANGQAVLQLEDGRQQSVSFSSLETSWFGDFTAFYKLPPYRQGDSDEDRERDERIWLQARLMELAGHLSTDRLNENYIKRLDLEEQIRWYQRRRGLDVDGIPGAMTIVQMNNDLDPEVPRLTERGVLD